jgi:hypothetical protein
VVVGGVDRHHYGPYFADTLAPLGTWLPHLLPIPNRYLERKLILLD